MDQFVTQMLPEVSAKVIPLKFKMSDIRINGQQNRRKLWCLRGDTITLDKPLLCPQCCMCVCLLAPEKEVNVSLASRVCNCCSK